MPPRSYSAQLRKLGLESSGRGTFEKSLWREDFDVNANIQGTEDFELLDDLFIK